MAWSGRGTERKNFTMRLFLSALIAACALPVIPLAEEAIEASTRDAVFVLATKGYREPASAEVRNVRKSLARNGKGYCGEVTIEGGGGFTVFHAILGGEGEASVLRLADYGTESSNNFAETVVRLLKNFGCVEPETAAAGGTGYTLGAGDGRQGRRRSVAAGGARPRGDHRWNGRGNRDRGSVRQPA